MYKKFSINLNYFIKYQIEQEKLNMLILIFNKNRQNKNKRRRQGSNL